MIQKYVNDTDKYLEPFVGGANIIDKIKCTTKIGADVNRYIIALLRHAKEFPCDFPRTILYQEYERVRTHRGDYPEWYVGLVGFCASYGGKFFGGYARHFHGDETGKLCAGTIRKLLEQDLSKIDFVNCDFKDFSIENTSGYTIYCDIPYKNTTKYSCGEFSHNEFYKWCFKMAEKNIILVSEYSMPDEFSILWEKTSTQRLDCSKSSGKELEVTERLFIFGGNNGKA